MDHFVNGPKESFGARLRRLRIAKGISQHDIAVALDVSAPAVCGWELGRTRPRMRRMHKLADLLGVSTDELLGIEPRGLHEELERSRREIAHMVGTTSNKDPNLNEQ